MTTRHVVLTSDACNEHRTRGDFLKWCRDNDVKYTTLNVTLYRLELPEESPVVLPEMVREVRFEPTHKHLVFFSTSNELFWYPVFGSMFGQTFTLGRDRSVPGMWHLVLQYSEHARFLSVQGLILGNFWVQFKPFFPHPTDAMVAWFLEGLMGDSEFRTWCSENYQGWIRIESLVKCPHPAYQWLQQRGVSAETILRVVKTLLVGKTKVSKNGQFFKPLSNKERRSFQKKLKKGRVSVPKSKKHAIPAV
jgi:hypothetical protein